MGALTQAPRHSTSATVKSPSEVECPGVIPSSFVIVSTMSSEPQSLQGVVVQTCRKYLPTGSRLNLSLETFGEKKTGTGKIGGQRWYIV